MQEEKRTAREHQHQASHGRAVRRAFSAGFTYERPWRLQVAKSYNKCYVQQGRLMFQTPTWIYTAKAAKSLWIKFFNFTNWFTKAASD